MKYKENTEIRWTLISKNFNRRTGNMIKNRYYSFVKSKTKNQKDKFLHNINISINSNKKKLFKIINKTQKI